MMGSLWHKVWRWLQSEVGLLIATVVLPPLGIVLVWVGKKFSQTARIVFTGVAALMCLIQVGTVRANASAKQTNADLRGDYATLDQRYDRKQTDYITVSHQYHRYKQKMAPYESLSKADAEKRKADAAAADQVTTAIEALPTVDALAATDEGAVQSARKLYNALSAAQKDLVDATPLTALEAKLPELKKQAAAAAAAAKKAADEARKGYETGITYDQLARTPDAYKGKKVKFGGEVVQVMEDGDSVQTRIAVNGDYDHMLLCEWSSSTVTSRVLENDQITIYGSSVGLITYESTMGGDITIPAVTVDKISQ